MQIYAYLCDSNVDIDTRPHFLPPAYQPAAFPFNLHKHGEIRITLCTQLHESIFSLALHVDIYERPQTHKSTSFQQNCTLSSSPPHTVARAAPQLLVTGFGNPIKFTILRVYTHVFPYTQCNSHSSSSTTTTHTVCLPVVIKSRKNWFGHPA